MAGTELYEVLSRMPDQENGSMASLAYVVDLWGNESMIQLEIWA